jgi:glyceraldehyde 3-phosphate dehydrogenase
MTLRIAINGFGRIGRNVTRALYESDQRKHFELVAINDLGDLSTNAHLLKYDSVHGRFSKEIQHEDNHLVIDGDKIRVCAERNPLDLPWKALEVDIVLECTGLFASKKQASMHLDAGAKKVLISAPAGDDVTTIVYGVNDKSLKPTDYIVSNASCTTNCLAPLVKVLHDKAKVLRGFMTTVHAYTNDQSLTDTYHKDLRRARAAAQSMIPTKTGAAAAVGLVMPELLGKLDGYAIRVPTINVSVVDFTCDVANKVTAEQIDQWMKEASKGELKGILAYTDEPLVSIDFNHNPASATFDASQTRVIDNMVKVAAWYDNEWGFSNRMLDTARAMGK